MYGLAAPCSADTRAVFRALFRAIGLPEVIRTDNGVPFAVQAAGGLSALTVWWMQLGITHQRIPPASPQYNGSHERMHRELKRETARPAAACAKRRPPPRRPSLVNTWALKKSLLGRRDAHAGKVTRAEPV